MTIEAEPNTELDPATLDSTGTSADHAENVDDANADDEEDNEVEVTFEGVAPPPKEEDDFSGPAPAWVKDVRRREREATKRAREVDRENAELKQRLAAIAPTTSAPAEDDPGPEPDFRGDDIDMDPERYKVAIVAWNARKAKADTVKAKREAEFAEIQKGIDEKRAAFAKAAAELKAPDFPEALRAVTSALDLTKQTIMMEVLDKPHAVTLGLGRMPEKLQELAALSPAKFSIAIAKLESSMSVSSRKPPPPERTPSPTGRAPGGSDKTLEALEREADKTGDRSKVIAHKQQKREQERQKK